MADSVGADSGAPRGRPEKHGESAIPHGSSPFSDASKLGVSFRKHCQNSPAMSLVVIVVRPVGAIFESLLAAWSIRMLSVGRGDASGAIADGLKRIWQENFRKPDGTSAEARSQKSKCESGR